jgi:hypothetical protein
MEIASEVWGRGDRNHRVSEERTGMMRWKRPWTTAVDDVPLGCSSSHLNLMTHTTTEHSTVLNDLFHECEQKAYFISDHKIFLMYILNEDQHEIVLKLIFHYNGNISQNQELLNPLSIQHSCTRTTWQCRVAAQAQQNPRSCMISRSSTAMPTPDMILSTWLWSLNNKNLWQDKC